MTFIKIIFLLVFLLLPILLYSADSHRNPFESLLPKDEAEQVVEGEEVEPLQVIVQGVLWGSPIPQAIIDGEVYKVGEQLKSPEDASVLRISKNVVFIAYGDKIHKMTVTKQ